MDGAAGPRTRPPGERGGYTVQDWEQPEPKAWSKPDPASLGAPRLEPDLGEVAPPVDPIYLRPAASTDGASGDTRPADTLVDAVTRRVLDLLAHSLHASVATAVRSLAPDMVITLAPPRSGEPAVDPPAAGGPEPRSDVTPAA